MSVEIKEGDVVELKSGGPAMTIDYIDGELANCYWFFGSELKDGKIFLAALEKVKLE